MTDSAPVQANITSYWHETATAYDEHPVSQIHMVQAKDAWATVWSEALPPPPADILDVGTGTGQVALLLAELGHRVTGLDLADGMLDIARAKSAGMVNPPVLARGDAVAPPFPPASFDAVTCRYLLWTLREPLTALANWRALLRLGGILVAIDGAWFADGVPAEDEDKAFRRLYDEQVFTSLPLALAQTLDNAAVMVADAGFADVHMTPLPEIERLERALVADPTTVRTQFLISARRGA